MRSDRLNRASVHAAWAMLAVVTGLAVTSSVVGSFAVRALTAAAAGVLMLRGTGRGDGMGRVRVLFAAALLTGATGGAAAAVLAGTSGRTPTTGGWIQWLALANVPWAVAGLLLVPTVSRSGLRSLANGVVAAGSLWYLALVLVVEPAHLGQGVATSGRLVTLGFVLGPVFVIAALLSILPRAVPVARPFLVRVAAGMALVVGADVCYSVATWRSGYHPDSWIAVVHQCGLLLVLMAAAADARPRLPRTSTRPRSPGQTARSLTVEAVLPFAPLTCALVVTGVQFAHGGSYTHEQMLPVLVVGVAVVLRQAVAVRDNGRLVTNLRAGERAARAEARCDALTGLANRLGFVDHLAAALLDPQAHPVAVALVDLNDFKDVNDTHGHQTGDHLLQECARRLREIAPLGGLVGRLGGDEFVLCQPAVRDGGRGLAAAVVSVFAEPVCIDSRRFTVRPSVGIVLDERAAGRAVAADAPRLLAHADVAMYQAKATKNVQSAPAVILTGEARQRAAGLIRLREEISDPDLRQFRVVYQPVVDLATGEIRGVEALLRWRHPELGEISPVQFIPLSEQVGSVTVLGEHVLRTAVLAVVAWKAVAPAARLAVGINLSPRQLADPGLAARVLDLAATNGLSADQLVLEITEGALMHDLDAAARLVDELRAGGASVAVDDFGTGYSSLGYLRRFAVDVLKIDREFIQVLPAEPRTAALVRSVVDMSASLDLQTIAEGIETTDQLRATQLLGCELGQGFLFSKPVEAEQIAALLVAGHRYDVRTGAASVGAHGRDQLGLIRSRAASAAAP